MKKMEELPFIATGIAMAIGLFIVGAEPRMGLLLPGAWHYPGHFVAFAFFGAVWRLGLPRTAAFQIAVGAIAFGFLHEAYEMSGHVHGFEFIDAVVDGIGAVVGVSSAALATSARASSR